MSTDFDLHGVTRIRLEDAPAAAVASVTANLGLQPVPRAGEADVVATFVTDLALPEPVRRVGRDAGFSGDQFVLGTRAGRRVAFTLAEDGRATMRCEPEVVDLPHLVSLVNLAMLRQGHVALHGSAVVHRNHGIVAVGWSKGGKTELVLGLMAAGATFVADEWCYLSATGAVLGLPHPVRVWDWQLRQLPGIAATTTRKQRARLAATRRLVRVAPLAPALEPTLGVSALPDRLFGASRIAPSCRLDMLVFVESRDSERIDVQRVDGAEVAARMRASLQAERADLVADTLRMRFAFPSSTLPDWDAVAAREHELLAAAFGNAPAWRVSHPYPVDLAALARAVADLPGAG